MTASDEKLLHLAQRLYEIMERLNPTEDAPNWGALPWMERDFYRVSVRELLEAEEYWNRQQESQRKPKAIRPKRKVARKTPDK